MLYEIDVGHDEVFDMDSFVVSEQDQNLASNYGLCGST